ncbi:hypothetical protein HYFRA_00007075 [Hymenoscyphus fraxineus]|uniref:PLC-like phosphodiesterase n=1 Tax=Hymenoscyphus fraxineus TaxID=746836 RepID=A0A9N9KWC4_9HELO|nr:hypothetical protein HYFRA_00007075 [Hymenoscyphus fraxineus]
MLLPLLSISTALLSLVGFVQAIPQAIPSRPASTPTRAPVSLAPAATGTTACNNSPDLCNRNYNNITHMGAHNSAFLRNSATSFSTSGNQFYNASVALSAGIRLLQAQVHLENGVLRLCHTSCGLLDAGPLVDWLGQIKSWMDANVNEVVTIILVNADNQPAATFGGLFASSGISTYGYTPASTSAATTWPTLQTLIAAKTRLVTFIASIDYDTTYPYLLPEFNYVFETAFGVLDLNGFNCTLDRPSTQRSAATALSAGYMGMLNHFLDTDQGLGITVPDVGNLTVVNGPSTSIPGALGTQGSQCTTEWGIKPTFILVNFFNVGPAMAVADTLNGIRAVGRTDVSTDVLTASSKSGGSRQNGRSWFGIAGSAMGVIAIGNFLWM